MEVHYYHRQEVWHALYNRAEEQHLRDPENKEVKDEVARRRQLDTHEGIMDMTFRDLRNKVASTAEFDASLRQVYSRPSVPIQAHEHFTVTAIQDKIRSQQRRKRKKLERAIKKEAQQDKTPSEEFAHNLLEEKKRRRKVDEHTVGGSPGSNPEKLGELKHCLLPVDYN